MASAIPKRLSSSWFKLSGLKNEDLNWGIWFLDVEGDELPAFRLTPFWLPLLLRLVYNAIIMCCEITSNGMISVWLMAELMPPDRNAFALLSLIFV